MKLNLSSLINTLKKIFAYGDRMRPMRDWFILLSVTSVLLIAGVVWNIFLFNHFQNVQTTTTSVKVTAQQGIGDSITKVQALFQQRAAEEVNYQQNYHFVDPSRPGS